MAAVTICSDFGAQKNKFCHCFHCFPIYLQKVMGPDGMILIFWMLSFKPAFSTRLLCPWNPPGKNTGGVAIPFFRWCSQPRNQTQVSCIADGFFTIWATGEALLLSKLPSLFQLHKQKYTLIKKCPFLLASQTPWYFRIIIFFKHYIFLLLEKRGK